MKAYDEGKEKADLWENPTTRISGLRAPKMLADFLCLRAIRESGGMAISVSDEAIFEAQREAGDAEGLFICPEGAACIAALWDLKDHGAIRLKDRVVVFHTASGLKYSDLVSTDVPVMDPLPEQVGRKDAG